jgi:hypothetical protein
MKIMAATESSTTSNLDRPIVCVLDSSHNMFRVTQAKGKALASGGFGVTIRKEANKEQRKEDILLESNVDQVTSAHEDPMEDLNNITALPAKSCVYLFIEEVLFLHERGLLQAMDEDENGVILDTSQLHQLLPMMGMSLSMYLIFSHLRSQEFRVWRHDPQRLEILRQQQQQADCLSHVASTKLCRQVQESIQHAPIPKIPTSSGIQICWDVYQPNCQFAKTRPGLPDFYVAATYYAVPLVSFSQLQQLVQQQCHGIPLKVATVSDSGTVVMFGISDYVVPTIKREERIENDSS